MREHQEQDTNPDYEITNSLALTVKTELTTPKKESIDQEKNETHLLKQQTINRPSECFWV